MERPLDVVQLAFCTQNMPRTVQLYTEVFGFADAGGRVFSGPWLAGVQGVGADAATHLWWLVGRQDLVQLELFTHTEPAQRPLPADWRPSDHGWVRFGLTVPDFDAALTRLARRGVPTLTDPIVSDGLRRVCFRDPHVGIVAEVLEEGASVPGGVRPRFYDLVPAVVYASLSVPDLAPARRLFLDVIGLAEVSPDTLHEPEHEALWGLPGARAERFVVRGGDIFVEVSRYDDPPGRPQPEGRLLSDQGFMNVAVGSRDRGEVDALLERMREAGYTINHELPPGKAGGTYVTADQDVSIEVLAMAREFDAGFGFTPQPAFLSSPGWPQPAVGPAREVRP